MSLKEYTERIRRISLTEIITGFPIYFSTLKKIFSHPFAFPNSINLQDKEQFWNAVNFACYSIAMCFFLLLPVFIIYKSEPDKFIFLIRMLVQFALYGLILHITLKVFGARAVNFRGTLTIYAYLTSTFIPLVIILQYPFLLKFGPTTVLFGTARDMQQMTSVFQREQTFLIYSLIVTYIIGITSLIFFCKWFSITHKITKLRVFFVVILSGLVLAIAQPLILNPVFNIAFEYLGKALKFIGT